MNTSPDSQRLFCTFRLAGNLFGVDMHDVKEVTTETKYTQIAHAPDEVLGLVNIRGLVYLALNLRQLLGLPPAPLTSDSRLVLFKPAVGHTFGVIVDELSEIHVAESDQIEAYSAPRIDALANQLRRVELIVAIVKLPEELLIVLNPRRFLTVVEQELAQSA